MDTPRRNVITAALPDLEAILDALPDEPGVPPEELRARTRLAYLQSQVAADADALEAAIDVLRARAAGDARRRPVRPARQRRDLRCPRRVGRSRDGRRAARPADRPRPAVRVGRDRRQAGAATDPVPRRQRRSPPPRVVDGGRQPAAARRRASSEYVELGRWMLLWTRDERRSPSARATARPSAS